MTQCKLHRRNLKIDNMQNSKCSEAENLLCEIIKRGKKWNLKRKYILNRFRDMFTM